MTAHSGVLNWGFTVSISFLAPGTLFLFDSRHLILVRGWIGRITRNLAIDFLKPLINAKQNSTFKFCSLIFLDLFFFRRQAPLHRHQRERSAVLFVVVIERVVPPTTIGFLMLDQDFGKHRSIFGAVFGLQLIDA